MPCSTPHAISRRSTGRRNPVRSISASTTASPLRSSKPSPLLRKLGAKSWGNSWGIYLTSAASLPDLRKHFRHFLMAEIEGEGGKSFYFRFYDPRVLRTYLPTCTIDELRQFFGPVGSFLVEDKDEAKLVRLRAGSKGLERESVILERTDVPR